MPKTHISKSEIINAPLTKVYGAVADLSQWQAWSPWLLMEPEAKIEVVTDKQSYSWEGDRVGAGHLAITDATENQSVRYDLTFLKPWKSTAKVGMDMHDVPEGTKITWTMDSQLPFFMFFMKKMMETFVGMDYERGLALLKDYVEDGKTHSKLNFVGESEYPGRSYIGIRRDATIADMPELMGRDFETLGTWAAENGLNPNEMFSIYNKFNPLKGKCRFTSAIPYEMKPENLPDGYIIGTQAPTRLYTLEHVGPYRHLGNAWSTLHTMIRNKEFKPLKAYPPFETYGNSPKDTDETDLITRVNFAIKRG